MSSDNYTNEQVAKLVMHVRKISRYEGITQGQSQVLLSAAEALESVVRDRNEARAKALEEAADSLDYLGHTWSGSVATHLFRDGEKLRERAAAIQGEEK